MKRWQVGIAKDYFPKALWPKGITAFYDVWCVMADTRTDAAAKVWKKYGDDLSPKMNPWVKKVSLHSGTKNPTGHWTRLDPIRVKDLEERR